MADHLKLYLFGDQTYDIQPHLKTLLKGRDNPILEAFVEKAYSAIRLEIYKLPVQARDDLPRFTSAEDLLLWDQGGKRCVPLDMAVTCMYQLAMFISEAESWNYSPGTSRLVGLCTGALAAAAVSCSRDVLHLLSLAVDAVVVAFRIGMVVTDAASRISPLNGSTQKWSVIIPGAASVEQVRKFCDQSSLPLTSKPYISAYGQDWITVSGPPTSIQLLIESGIFTSGRFKSIPVHGPYHAPHLYSEFDIGDIVAEISTDGSALQESIRILPSNKDTSGKHNFTTILKDAVRQILLQPINWRSILDEIQSWIGEAGAQSFSVIPIGTTADQIIHNEFRQTSLRMLTSPTHPYTKSSSLTHSSSSTSKKPKLAIIGMSGRFPGAKDVDAFWDLLYQGLDVHKPVPPLRWDSNTHVDLSGSHKNTSATPYGCWLDNPAEFDARFFNISPREAPQIDPAQRLALMTAYEAIEQAGIVPDATPSTRRDRVGVFYGVTSNDWMETNSAQNIDTYFIPGGNRAFIPGRINYCFKFSGPSYAVDTACSSSLAGIHIACNSLWRGDIDTAIAGGTNVLTNPDFTAGLDRGHFLSRTGNCKTFDDSADGYCRGEGIGTVIIKRLDDALADNDPILGVILGAYTNHSAESESITRPHVGAQRAIFKKVLSQGGVDPYAVGYVEMHGTGTQAGDAGEMSSVLDTFAPSPSKVDRGRSTDQNLYIGSAKANIGHGEASAGVSSLMKVLLMMQKDTIVPHCGIKTKINHRFPTDLEQRNVNIALKPIEWKRNSDSAGSRYVFVNNFSAAGGNSALLLEDAPLGTDLSKLSPDTRSHHVIAVSAKNGVSLQGNLRSLLECLNKNSNISLPQLSYTTTARRIQHPHRVMLFGATVKDIRAQAMTVLNDNKGLTRPKSAPKVIFTFTGQGALYPGMGQQFFENFSVFRLEMLRLDQLGRSLGFESMLPVIESTAVDMSSFSPVAVHLASVCMQICLSKLYKTWNITPMAVTGHSLGEYAALNVSGVLSDVDTLYLVGTRATLIQAKCTRDTHAMLVIKGSEEDVRKILNNSKDEFACFNSPIETVLAGSNDRISTVKSLLGNSGILSTILKVPYAFHSSQLDPILADLQESANTVTFSHPNIPVICPLHGDVVHEAGHFNPEHLAKHAREPVNMMKALISAQNENLINASTIMLEIGPHPAISSMVKATLGPQTEALASSQRGRGLWQTLGPTLGKLYCAGAEIHWAEYHRDFKASHKVLSLPAYSWDTKDYWIQYVNDWSLRKGDPPLISINTTKLESTTIHNIVEESGDSRKTRIVVEADITRKDLSPLVQGHEVDGIPLCTPSVYADIALTLGKYLLERHLPNQKDQQIDVSDMTISKALILKSGATKQLLQAHAEADWVSQTVAIKFMSFDSKQKLQEHSRCVVRFNDGGLQQALQSDSATVRRKLDTLRAGIVTGTTARFNRPMVYRAIRPLARFHNDYRAIDEIILNSNTLEATSRLSFGNVKRDGNFHTHPAIIDALTQSCGFTMNCNDFTDLDEEVFMNHGWGSFQMFEAIDFEKEYVSYTHMEQGPDKLWLGDVVIFDGDRIVAHFGKIAIQGVPRRVLKVILSIESGGKSQKQQPFQPKQQSSTTLAPAPVARLPLPVPAEAQASKLTQALSIIAEESGLAETDLTDGTDFSDVGIDSLLGLTISARFKEELDVDLDFNALFYEHPTVGDLKMFLGGSPDTSTTGVSTPRWSDSAPTSTATRITTPDPERQPSLPKLDFQAVLQIVSEESGIALNELTDDMNFADTGVDSLMSLVVVSRFRDELELDIQHEALFLECPTVADLRRILIGDSGPSNNDPVRNGSIPDRMLEIPENRSQMDQTNKINGTTKNIDVQSIAARKEAVNAYVRKYTAGFSVSTPSSLLPLPNDSEKVVLVTGASGSLGGNLVYHLAQLPDVKQVVCLNRENKAEPYDRQQKAMRSKGIRFPEALKHKLLVFQTNSSNPNLGLPTSEYEALVDSVTHLIHNAWPMSAKRSLSGFESQFQTMRNLIDLASAAASRHPENFKFSFEMVSSIGVVGHFGLGNGEKVTKVPEERASADSVLPNGYGDAKWGCEMMLDETLHKHPHRFRTMASRLGQIAGSKTSGYWNPMEHFGFLVKSSQTLGALPDVDGKAYWTPVNDVAAALSDLVLSTTTPHPIYHIENPVGQPWSQLNTILAEELKIGSLIPFEEWVERVRQAPQHNNPAATLLEFLDSNYLRMSCGGLVLDVKKSLEHSKSLAEVGAVSEEVVRKYIHVWKEIGFLN
ncbi:ketoacyl-synt-domain-containing protein [Massarina eburnea CBS 473.64]|uniref:Ketoacyl-synt-domain-containing protein n=1 Tax=Massarina eburnea CBS 473.64 TaxID=1395130 RepID=A0A6A6RSJ0_9PLEO|nr:ketoacyl-synt-domain-containing protein [Massarina eburnea CBS 473.64]